MTTEVFHIMGGGIAGLASAIAVSNSGHQAIILEKAEKFDPIGAGLQLGPNAVEALQKIGAWDAVSPSTTSPSEIQIRNGLSGKILKSIPLGKSFEARFGMPYRVAHRADLHAALLAVARAKKNIEIRTGVNDANFRDHRNVIAADGLWSKTRTSLFPNTEAIVTPEVFYRALAPRVSNDNVTLWLYPGGHVVHYPIGTPAKLNIVAITQGKMPLLHFSNACDDLKRVLEQVPDWTTWPAAYVPPLKKWNDANITLIGDAAHGTLPYLAQGAAMALEDAAALQNIFQSVQNAKVAEIFVTFSGKRIYRTTALHKSTLSAGRIYHFDGLKAALRDCAVRCAPNEIFSRQQMRLYKS